MNRQGEQPTQPLTRNPRTMIQDDADLGDNMRSPSNRSTGGTPIRRVSTPILVSPPGSREPTPLAASYEDLAYRPRSNPRSRTPMRFESPLNANAFRELSPPAERREGQRVTVRPLAGAAVGTTLLSRRIIEERQVRSTTPTARSSKQGPSHRKVRRWNNDGFVGLASELAQASSRGSSVAEAFLHAQADAPKYRSIISHDARPSAMSAFIQNEAHAVLRQQFFSGEIGHGAVATRNVGTSLDDSNLAPALMLNRIHERLRNVIVRACASNDATAEIVDAFEKCLQRCWIKGKPKSLSQLGTLLEAPSMIQRKSGHTTAKFYFDADSSNGGFHRLLLHAVCQFHCLHAVSTTSTINDQPARLLTVTGKTYAGPNIKLTDQIYVFGTESQHIVGKHSSSIQSRMTSVAV